MTTIPKTSRLAWLILWATCAVPALADEYYQAPINYAEAEPQNPVSRLIEELEAGKVRLEHHPEFGYLRSVLEALDVPESSQTLVFSKTSLQRQRISPRTPRALYFNDDVYVGYCQNGDMLELSVADPQLGAVFYTLAQDAEESPKIERQGDSCLICHGGSQTREIPGHLLRSVFVDPAGLPILSAGTRRIDQTSPFDERWGGWYVTGTHGEQKHRGNLVIRNGDAPHEVDNAAGMNVTDLGDRINAKAYPSGHSDLVALLVLEHQTEAHNMLTRANFGTRRALHYQITLNKQLGEPEDHVWDSVVSRIENSGEALVEYLLFSGEAELTHRITGTSGFAEEFVKQGPRDKKGRSLRDFDLQTRLFKYPCSYLIYSPSFQALPEESRRYVFDRMWQILSGQDQSPEFAHLTPDDRQAILEILRDTVPELPASWRTPDAKTP